MSDTQQDFWKFNNLIPLVSSAVMITLAFGALLTRVAVIETQLTSQKEVLARIESKLDANHESSVSLDNLMSNRISVLETQIKIR